MRKVVLVVEDKIRYLNLIVAALGQDVECLEAMTIPEAEELFAANRDRIDAIILDACVPGDDINTVPLLRLFRSSGFAGPIVASSSSPHFGHTLVREGCDVAATKHACASVARRLLELS